MVMHALADKFSSALVNGDELVVSASVPPIDMTVFNEQLLVVSQK